MLLATPKLAELLLPLDTATTNTVGVKTLNNQKANQGDGAVASPDSGFYTYLWQHLQSTASSGLPAAASTELPSPTGQGVTGSVESGNTLPPGAVPSGNTMPLLASADTGLRAVAFATSPALMSIASSPSDAGPTAASGEQRLTQPTAVLLAGQPPQPVAALLQRAGQASAVQATQDAMHKQATAALSIADPYLGGMSHLQSSQTDSLIPWLKTLEGSRVMSWPEAGHGQPEMLPARATSAGLALAAGTLGAATTLSSLGPQTPSVTGWVNTIADMPALASTPLPALDHPQWGQVLAQRALWLTANQTQAATLRLDPPELGPLQVRITLDKDQASVSFIAQHQPVREAVEAALPRLREMFAASDLQLVDVDVQQHSHERGVDQQSAQNRPAMEEISVPIINEELDPGVLEITPRGLIDYYV